MSRFALNGMLGLYIQLLCHLISIVCEQIFIKRFMVPGNGTSDGRSMCSKYSGNLRNMLLNIQSPQACHPLVSLINDMFTLPL